MFKFSCIECNLKPEPYALDELKIEQPYALAAALKP
jgi:hypothetical protein